MQSIVRYFIKYGISGNVLLFLVLIFGYFGLDSMRRTFFPEVPSRIINIQAVYPGASPEEIEESVVLKIEDNLKGTSGIERVTSISNENQATITVEIKQKADIDLVLQDVKNAVDRITSFPTGLESLDTYKREALSRAMSFAIHGDVDLKTLKASARAVERDLLAIEGISKVALSGFPEEELVISIKEQQLAAYGLTFQQVSSAIAGNNVDITGGTVIGDNEELKIRSTPKAYYADELKSLVVKANADGSVVRLKDVANVEDRWAEVPNMNFYNGRPSVTIDVSNTNDEDLLFIADELKEYIEVFNSENEAIQANITKDASTTVVQRIDLLVDNGIIGFILVFVFLALFLHYRLAFWVALAIPICFAGAFILSPFFGITINVISLFGMITVIGILVDDGVVISENIYRRYELGEDRITAAVNGTMEVLPAVFSAIATTIVAFSTFFFIDGTLGDFFSEMSFIVIATLIFSLIEGVFILPAHIAHSKALDRKVKPNKLTQYSTRVLDWLKNKMYAPVLEFFLDKRFLAIAIPFTMLLLTFGAISGGIITTTFFPFIEGEEIVVTLKMPSGTPEELTLERLNQVEAAIWETNNAILPTREDGENVVLSVDKRLGPGTTSEGKLNIKLLDNEARQMPVLEISNMIRENSGDLLGVEEFSFGTGTPFGKPVSVALKGTDQEEVRIVVEKLKKKLRALSDLKDVNDDDLEGLREIQIKLKDKAYLLGLTEQQVMLQIRQGYFGGEIQRLQRGLDEVKVWVRYAEEERASQSSLGEMKIRTNDGKSFQLKDLAEFEMGRGVVGIKHSDGERQILVSADIANSGVSVNNILASISDDILPKILEDHPTIKFSFEGQQREQAKTAKSMKTVGPVVLLLMLAIIVLTFRSFSQTFAVLALIPFSFIGVAWGHWIHGLQISLFSYLGIIALIGIIVNDALVFVGAYNINLKAGMDVKDAIRDASLSRFRPILLTSLTTMAGLGPLIIETSMQAQFLIPMAAAIAYGLGVATVSVLVLLPVLLMMINVVKRKYDWFWNGKNPLPKEVEPAYKELKYED
jgi:multidrug efflux pump subunit AcrB